MASPNTSGSQPSEPLVQRNSTLRPTSPAATSVQNHVPDKDETIVTQTAVKSHANRDKWIEYAQWALTVLGIAATCIFGAWAPLSYKATLDGNSGNNAAQSSVAKAAFAANSQAREAASQQRAALDAMNSRIEAVGQLWLYNFCLDQTVRNPVWNIERKLKSSAVLWTLRDVHQRFSVFKSCDISCCNHVWMYVCSRCCVLVTFQRS